MKKVLILLFIIASVFSACKKNNDYVFNQSPDDRINAAITSYQSKLTGAVNGWKALITVNGGTGGTYSFYFKFSEQNRVKMYSDFDSSSAVTSQESSYRIKAEQQPTLIFDTYSYVHVLADPNESTVIVQANVNGGSIGQGLLSDFEFIIDSAKIKTDSIELTGKVNHSKLILIRATKAEEDAYNSGALGVGLSINKILTYFKRLTVGAQSYDIKIDPSTRQFVFSWLDVSGNLKTFTTGYYFVAGGIVFTPPFVNGSQVIAGFTNMILNPATETITLTAAATVATITGVVVPLKIDLGAPKRWWDFAVNNGNEYWISVNGFHVNGVEDAYNVNSLVSATFPYYYYIYFPKFGTSNDFFGPIFVNTAANSLTLQYGTAPDIPTFTTDGRGVFRELGTYGTNPTTGPAALTGALLYNSSGYYFVQTSATTYDMVSASNGKSWITWEWIF